MASESSSYGAWCSTCMAAGDRWTSGRVATKPKNEAHARALAAAQNYEQSMYTSAVLWWQASLSNVETEPAELGSYTETDKVPDHSFESASTTTAATGASA
jgi:hypothetical protein